jgi:mRNA cleavage and polyadenylation factor CLP1 P-loop
MSLQLMQTSLPVIGCVSLLTTRVPSHPAGASQSMNLAQFVTPSDEPGEESRQGLHPRPVTGTLVALQTIAAVCDSPTAAPRALVCGSKRVGKSTLARHLTAALLLRFPEVALLDTDCGQPELGPPGFVSLSRLRHGLLLPAPLHTRQPDEMICIGDSSAQGHPALYMRAVAALAARHSALDSEAGVLCWRLAFIPRAFHTQQRVLAA